MKEIVKQNISKVPKLYYIPLIGDPREFVCGWSAAMVNITLTYPVNKIIFRQMLHGISVKSAFLQIVDEGIVTLYRGMLPPLLQKSVSSSLMFGTYDMFRKHLSDTPLHPIVTNSISAILAGSVEAVLTPFERIQTLLQDSAYQKQFVNMKHAVKVVGMEYGFREFYRGLTPVLFRNGPSNVVFFLLREEFNERIPQSNHFWGVHAFQQFFVGACIGALNSTLFYPFNVVKVHMQSKLGGEYISMKTAFRELYIERGKKISNFYKGVHMNYSRSFVSWGVINLAYERFKIILFSED